MKEPQCSCGSYAINHHKHGRDGSDNHLCDVCYWRKRATPKWDAARVQKFIDDCQAMRASQP